MKKSVSQRSEQNPVSVAATTRKPESQWTEGDISIRTGNCNVLLIAPHGRPEDDTNTGKLTWEIAELLDCYAVINEKYIKTSTAGVPEADPENFIADLYKQSEANLHQVKPIFLDAVVRFKYEIIYRYQSLYIIHVHGIATNNTPKVAKLISEFQKKTRKLQAVIGYGQWRNNLSKPTADLELTVKPFINRLMENGLQATIAPVDPIKVNGLDTWYCGWDDDRLNQYLYDPKVPMQSFQIEIKEAGVRDKPIPRSKAAKALAAAIKPFLVSADQNGLIQQIPLDEIDLKPNSKFMSRLDGIESNTIEFKRLVDSIKRLGILNPVIVRKRSDTDGKPYQLISGFRRLTALKASINRKDLDGATVPARVLKDSVTDDEAYQISFTENLARQDLSLWEIAKACAKIRDQKIAEGGMSKGQIEKHLAELIQKDTRTVRRYLKLASIKDDEIKKAVHYGNISPTTALEIGEKDLVKDEPENISVLLNYLRNHPKTTREFEWVYGNLEYCCECSKLSLAAVLECKNADGFLSLEKDELEKRIENLHSKTGKKYPDILKGKAGSLLKDTFKIDDGLKRKDAGNKFKAQNKDIIDRVHEAFKQSKISGKFKIKPASGTGENRVTVTITVPENKMWQAIDVISTANISQAGRVVRRKESKKRPSKFVSPASNSVEKPESIIKDESKTVYRGSFKK